MGEYVPAGEASKAAVESVVRVKWEEGDKVYVLDNQQCLGYLTTSVDPDDPRYATLSGKVKNTSFSKLLLIYCPTLTLNQGTAMTSVEFDFSEQVGEEIPFVIYKVIDRDFISIGEDDLMETPDRIIQFEFASSIMKVNLTGLADNDDISEAVISQINNGLSISMGSNGAATVTPKIGGSTITRRGDKGFSNVTADGRAAFSVAMFENTGNASRKISVKTSNGIISSSNFTASALEVGASYNSVYALKGTEYVTIGGKKWAIMNLGATTIASNAATAYGDYYEWGMTRKLYKSVSFSAYNDGSFSFLDDFKDNGYSWQSYIGAGSWDPAKDFKPYDETLKVLTSGNDIAHQTLGGGWRMPTSEDFVALYEACGGTGKEVTPSVVSGARNADGSLNKGIYWCEYGQSTVDYIKVPGVLFVDGSGNALFFPAAGDGYLKLLLSKGKKGCYWSSSLVSDKGTDEYGTGSALFMDFSDELDVKKVSPKRSCTRFYGQSIRPVSD